MKRMLFVFLCMSIGATSVSPLFPLYQGKYHLSNLEITLLFATYAVFLLPVLMIVGSRGSSWGLKKVLRASVILSVLSACLFLIGGQAWILYAARALEGIAFGAFTGTASAFLMRQSSSDQSGKVLFYSGMIISFGFGLGPAITGLMIQYIAIRPLHLPFWFLAFLLIFALIALETLKEDSANTAKGTIPKISLGVPENIRSYFWSFVALPIFTVFTLNGIVLSLIPTFARSVIHTSNLAVSGLLILILLGGSALAQLIPWPISAMSRMRFGVLFLLTGTWLTVLSGVLVDIGLLWLGISIQAIGTGWTFQESLKMAGRLPRPEQRAKVISTFYFSAYSGFIVPIIGVGILSFFFQLDLVLIVLNAIATLIVCYLIAFSFKAQKLNDAFSQNVK